MRKDTIDGEMKDVFFSSVHSRNILDCVPRGSPIIPARDVITKFVFSLFSTDTSIIDDVGASRDIRHQTFV